MNENLDAALLDEPTKVLAHRIAAIKRQPVRDVIRHAVEQAARDAGLLKVKRTEEERQEMLRRVDEIVERFSKLPVLDNRDPHTILEWDEWGLPK